MRTVLEEQEYKPVTRWALFFMIRTRRGLGLLDRLGTKRITKPLAWFMLYLMPIAAGVSLFFIFQLVAIYFSPQGQVFVQYVRTISPLANFLLPGINPYLPLSVWVSVIVAVVIHEASHGIVARSLGFPVKSAGVLLLLFLPIGAFVEIDDRQLKEARSRDSIRVLAAGAGINFIVGILCLALLILSVASMVPVVRGAAVLGVSQDTPQQHSPAWLAGIRPGDFIVAINGTPVTDVSMIRNGSFAPGQNVTVTIWRNGQTQTLPPLTLSKITYIDTRTNQTSTYPFLGVEQVSYDGLQAVPASYSNAYKTTPLAYLAWIPTFPRFETSVPFSDQLGAFYTSPLGPLTSVVTSTLYWMFFVNFNLAIFNALPIYPMDGGQAFENFLRGAGRGKISDVLARRVTTGVTLTIFIALFLVLAGPYISGALAPALNP